MLDRTDSRKRDADNAGFALAMQAQATAPPPAPASIPAAAKTEPLAVSKPSHGDKLAAAMTAFHREAKMTPLERARRDVLKDKSLTEELIRAMPPADREKTETMIAQEVMKRLRLSAPVRTDMQITTLDDFLRDQPVPA